MAMTKQNTSNPKLGHYIKKPSKNDCPDLIKEYCNDFLLEMETQHAESFRRNTTAGYCNKLALWS